MKELDFDELDKAVNSLMSQTSKKAPDDARPAADAGKTAARSQSPTPPSRPAPATPSTTPAPAAPPAKENNLAPKRSGRFLDVVHPSADMKTPSRPALKPRARLTVTPLNDAVAPEPVKAKPSAAPAQPETPPATPAAPVAEKPSATAWPDPIDMHAAATEKQADQPAPAAPTSEGTADSPPAPTEDAFSPFLAGANDKVEKRPLGGGASKEDEPAKAKDTLSAPLAADGSPEEDESQTPAPLPAELSQDVLSIESDTADHAKAAPDITPAKVETVKPTGPSSISQQYKSQPSTGDQHHEALYDSASITPPLTHPAKKKSGWLTVLFIVILILIGAGGAAALYFSNLL